MSLILQHWEWARIHDQPLRAVYAIINSAGYILSWSVSKRQAAKELDRYGEAHGRLLLVRMTPT